MLGDLETLRIGRDFLHESCKYLGPRTPVQFVSHIHERARKILSFVAAG
jgi:hypothetical protein